MTVSIRMYTDDLAKRFETEEKRLRDLLGDDASIEHVGSSAVGIGGKNIIDILVGVKDIEQMSLVRGLLAKSGYFEGRNSHIDRIFMASSEEETGEGDFHVHICLMGSEPFKDFLILRDFLRANPEKAREYYEKKRVFARMAEFDREKYKKLKSNYVADLLNEAKIAKH